MITTACLLTMSCNGIILTIVPTPYAGIVESVHRIAIKNHPVAPDSIQGSRQPISAMSIKYRTRANDLP